MHRTAIRVYIIIVFILFLLPGKGWTQPGDPGPKPGVPITGFEWLLLGGGLWGARKIYDLKKRK